jgi:DNA polymerase III subunit epsilon
VDFTAIDFETATTNRLSACAVGAAVVRDGRVTDVFRTLIRPPVLDFDKRLVVCPI